MRTERKILRPLGAVLIWAAIGIELCLLADVLLMFAAVYLPMRSFLLICLGLLAASGLLVLRGRRAACWVLAVLTALILAGCVFLQLFYRHSQRAEFQQGLRYHEVDSGKEALFAEKNVLLLVPHQDDDMNVLCGVIDEYLRYGSGLTVAFTTNGDNFGLGETRIREALDLYAYLGVPEDHVIFLGYGDRLHTDEYHIYNAPAGEVIPSQVDRTETYGLEGHPPFRPGRAYTRENLYGDIRDLILSLRPDVIFCVDYDSHVDHRACSLLFEEAMGEILRAEPDYSPAVYKGFAYSTSWGAEHDFHRLNLGATRDIYHNSMLIQTPPLYRWEDRARFPVRAGTLSRTLQSCVQVEEMQFYSSQKEETHAPAIVNGDRVFWRRATDSLCARASISASSGDPSCLNDFKLLDSRKLSDPNHDPFDGVWTPDAADGEKTVTVLLESPSALGEIVLYDNPDAGSNVLNAEVLLDDGTRLETGPLDVTSAPTRFRVEPEGEVSSFSVRILSAEGDWPGLTEIEAFAGWREPETTFVKLMDLDGNFAYDYILDRGGTQRFLLYSDAGNRELSPEAFDLQCDGSPECRAEIRDGYLVVECGRGQSGTVLIRDKASGLTDSIFVRNPGLWERFSIVLAQRLELIRLEDHELLHLLRWASDGVLQ